MRLIQPRKPPKSQMKTSSSRNTSGNDPRPRTPDGWPGRVVKRIPRADGYNNRGARMRRGGGMKDAGRADKQSVGLTN